MELEKALLIDIQMKLDFPNLLKSFNAMILFHSIGEWNSPMKINAL